MMLAAEYLIPGDMRLYILKRSFVFCTCGYQISNATQSCNHEIKRNKPTSGNIKVFILHFGEVGVQGNPATPRKAVQAQGIHLQNTLCPLKTRETLRWRNLGTFLSAARRVNNLLIPQHFRTLRPHSHSDVRIAPFLTIGGRNLKGLRSATVCPAQGKGASIPTLRCT